MELSLHCTRNGHFEYYYSIKSNFAIESQSLKLNNWNWETIHDSLKHEHALVKQLKKNIWPCGINF